MIIYIAGPMTGRENKNRGAFQEAERALEAQGHVVLNPAVLPEGLPPTAYMPICLAMLEQADAIYMLPGWGESPGATLERRYAIYQGKAMVQAQC